MTEISQLLVIKAMDALALRQTAIAQNVANSGSESYALRTVDFEAELRKAARSGPDAIRQFRTAMRSAGTAQPGEEIRIDLELQSAASTAMRYAALSDILGRQMQIARATIGGGQ